MNIRMLMAALAGAFLLAGSAQAQAPAAAPPPPPDYGMPITLEQAKKVMAAAEVEAKKTGFNVAIYIVEPSGELVMMERMDNAQYGSVALAQKKAETSARFKRPSQAFQDRVKDNVFLLSLGAPTLVGGGLPIMSGGKVIGAIGVSGTPTSPQDELVAKAGADAVK